MDKNASIVLRVDIETQMTQLEEIYEKLEQRAQDMEADDPARLESIAYQIHNLYNAVEDLLKIVAAHFENHIADADRWHSALLKRMAQMIPALRPALLSETTFRLLDSLRSFRHFFRHAYSADIDLSQLMANLAKARQLRAQLQADVKHFLDQLDAS